MEPRDTWQHKRKRPPQDCASDLGKFLKTVRTLSPEEKDDILLGLVDDFEPWRDHPALTEMCDALNEFRQVNQELIAAIRRHGPLPEVIPGPGHLVEPSGDGAARNTGEDIKNGVASPEICPSNDHVGYGENGGSSNSGEDSKNLAASCRESGHVGSATAVPLPAASFTGNGGERNSNEDTENDVFTGRVTRPRSCRRNGRAQSSGYDSGKNSDEAIVGCNREVVSLEARRTNNLVRPAVTVVLPPSRNFYADNVGGRNFDDCHENYVSPRRNRQEMAPGSPPVNNHAGPPGASSGITVNRGHPRNIVDRGNRRATMPGFSWRNDGGASGYVGFGNFDWSTERYAVPDTNHQLPSPDSHWTMIGHDASSHAALPVFLRGNDHRSFGGEGSERNLQVAPSVSRLEDFCARPSGSNGGGRTSDDKGTEKNVARASGYGDGGKSYVDDTVSSYTRHKLPGLDAGDGGTGSKWFIV